MSRKRTQEHSVSPKIHRVTWTQKRTRRGLVFTAEDITPSSMMTPVKTKRPILPQETRYSQDQTPISDKGIRAAISLPPIPAPEILASKKDRRGKVCL